MRDFSDQLFLGDDVTCDVEMTKALEALELNASNVGRVNPALRDAIVFLPVAWSGSYTHGTVGARKTDLRRFLAWCTGQGISPFSDSNALGRHIGSFMVAVAPTLGPDSLKRTGAHIAALMRGLGLPDVSVAETRRLVVRAKHHAATVRKTDRQEKVWLTAEEMALIEASIASCK
ncbi:hypothetical protein ACOI1H_13330 [Loktanella sp. DJP18]|uniref:hypothetical protein n=1 Tax=Loktanella sp. DJP18 TaxID=3409788 RepID=UPI003BB6D611